MTVKLRPVLASIPTYVPGRAIPGAVKLSSNETPYPPLPYVLERAAAAAAAANRYPDAANTELTEALAMRYGLTAEQIAVGCGSVSLLQQLVQAAADAGEEVLYAWRSFEAYPILTAVAGAAAVQVPLTTGYRHDLAAMAAAITDRTRVIMVCNPNNPTGTAVTEDELRTFLARVPSDVVVALDEAYREYVTDPAIPDGLTLLADFPNVVVFRTFSKAYGLAGFRVGYAIAADPEIATALRQTQIPFAVTTVSQQAALASLEPPAIEQLNQRVSEAVAERLRLRAQLLALGYQVPVSQANFLWLPLGAATADWANGAAEHGVMVRPFAADGVRVTVGSPAENERLLAAAAALRAER